MKEKFDLTYYLPMDMYGVRIGDMETEERHVNLVRQSWKVYLDAIVMLGSYRFKTKQIRSYRFECNLDGTFVRKLPNQM